MKSNSEQFPSNNSTEIPVPHSGKQLDPTLREVPIVEGLPDLTEDEINNTEHPENPYEGLGGDNVTLSPAEKAKIEQGRASVASQYAIPKTAETAVATKPNMLKRAGAGLAVVALAAGAWFVGANSEDKDNGPQPVPTVAGPALPGQGEPTVEPTANETIAAGAPLPVEQWTFTTSDGEALTQAEVISEVVVSSDEYEGMGSQYEAIFERIESAVNYFPNIDEEGQEVIRKNLGIPADQPIDREHLLTIVDAYQQTVFDKVIAGGGPLRDMVDQLGKDTAFNHVLTIGYGDAELYAVTIKQDILLSQTVTIENNGHLNSIGPSDAPNGTPTRNIGKFRYNSPVMNDLAVPSVPLNKDPATYQRGYQITGGARLIELE